MQSFAIESLIRSEASRLLSLAQAAGLTKDEIVKDNSEDPNESQCSSSNESNTFNDCSFSGDNSKNNHQSSGSTSNVDYLNLKLSCNDDKDDSDNHHDHMNKINHYNQHLARTSPIG